MDWSEVAQTALNNGWILALVLALGIMIGIPYMLVSDRLVTRGRLRSLEKDRDWWRKAYELERDRADRASASVTRMLPAAEQAVRMVEAITDAAGQRVAVERGETG